MRRVLVAVLVALTAVVTWSVAAPAPAFAATGDTWASRDAPASSWRSIAFDGARVVAVADSGADRVFWSTGGTPNLVAVPEDNPWTSVVWAGAPVNRFVAVASDGVHRVMTSPDGSTWTLQDAPAGAWQSVTWNPTAGLLVAVANNDTNRVMTSSDGVSWTPQTDADASAGAWTAVTWAGGTVNRYVAVAATGTTRVMTSPDGVAWTPQTDPDTTTSAWTSVASDGGWVVAVASGGTNRVVRSADGAGWSVPTTGPAANSWRAVATFGPGKYVAVGSSGVNRVTVSTDNGDTWTGYAAAPAGNSWTAVTLAGPFLVAVSSDGAPRAMYSGSGGASWATLATNGDQWQSVAFGNGLFVAVADSGSTNRVMTSPDGVTWTLRAVPDVSNWRAVTYGNGKFVAVANTGTNRVMTSTDGITWSPQIAAAQNFWESVAYGNGRFVAVSLDGPDRVMTSTDGVNWTLSGDGDTGADPWESVTFGNGTFVAVSTDGKAMSSTNVAATAWTVRTTPVANQWTSVTFGNDLFVAVALSGTNRVMTSPTGTTWTSSTDTADTDADPWSAVTFGAGTFVAVDGGEVMTSTNGTAWNRHTAAENAPWNAVTFANGVFVAVAGAGVQPIMTSGTFAPPTNPPTITSFTPTSGPVGTTVVITGTNFVDGDTRVFFDGVEATDVSVDSPTRITAVVPEGATTGPITVSTSDGSAVSADDFTVTVVAKAIRISGPDELDTAIAVSQSEFPDDGTAGAVVLARSDWFADALAGGPLAAAVDGPLLLTHGAPQADGDHLPTKVLAEIDRVIDPTDPVYVLGGPLAVSSGVEDDLVAAGYTVVRLAGVNQFATAVAIADEIGTPGNILEATGWNFPDALSAVPAAIRIDGVILLTNNNQQAPETQAYIDAHPGVARYTIGGNLVAGGADPTATNVSGQNLYDTSAKVADRWFPNPDEFGVATGNNFPDALAGGVFMATGDRMGPMLLVNGRALPVPPSIVAYLGDLEPGTTGYAFGGVLAVSTAVLDAVMAAVGA